MKYFNNVRSLVEATSRVVWRKDGEYEGRTGEAGGRTMTNDMIRLLPQESAEARLQQVLS